MLTHSANILFCKYSKQVCKGYDFDKLQDDDEIFFEISETYGSITDKIVLRFRFLFPFYDNNLLEYVLYFEASI